MKSDKACPGSNRNLGQPKDAVELECPFCGTWQRVKKDGALRLHKVGALKL